MTTYALIPGAGGDPWEWSRLIPVLTDKGHRVIAVRLPADDDQASWNEYADTVVCTLDNSADVVVVASSMGGFTGPIVCTRRKVDLLVLLNAMIPMPCETFNSWGAHTGVAEARADYQASLGLTADERKDDAIIYYHDVPPDVRARAQTRSWQAQSNTPLNDPWPLKSWPAVPTRVIAGREDRMFPFSFQRRVARERLGVDANGIDGGHMLALSNPGGLADRLEELTTGSAW